MGNSTAAAVMAPLLWQALPMVERDDWVASVLGRDALRASVHQLGVGGWGKRRVRCVPAETEGVVVVVARLKVRHVPRHVPWLQSLGEKRCGSVFNSKEKRRRCGVPAETGVVARLKVRRVPWLQFNS